MAAAAPFQSCFSAAALSPSIIGSARVAAPAVSAAKDALFETASPKMISADFIFMVLSLSRIPIVLPLRGLTLCARCAFPAARQGNPDLTDRFRRHKRQFLRDRNAQSLGSLEIDR